MTTVRSSQLAKLYGPPLNHSILITLVSFPTKPLPQLMPPSISPNHFIIGTNSISSFRKMHHQLRDMKCCWRHNLQPQIDFFSHWARHYDVTIWTSKSRSYLSNLSSSSTRRELPPFSPTVVFTPPWRTHRPSLEEIVCMMDDCG